MRLLTVLVIYSRFEKFKIQHIQRKSKSLVGVIGSSSLVDLEILFGFRNH